MNGPLAALACRLAERVDGGFVFRVLAAHRRRCARCVDRERALERVAAALTVLPRSQEPEPLPSHLRGRVLDAYEREMRARRSAPGILRRDRLASATLATGALATAAILAAVLLSRVDDFGEPPRTVRIELPQGTHAVADPVIVVRRASGREERR